MGRNALADYCGKSDSNLSPRAPHVTLWLRKTLCAPPNGLSMLCRATRLADGARVAGLQHPGVARGHQETLNRVSQQGRERAWQMEHALPDSSSPGSPGGTRDPYTADRRSTARALAARPPTRSYTIGHFITRYRPA